MKSYYFHNTVDVNNRHEIHAEDCSYLPSPSNRTYLGNFYNCYEAILTARLRYPFKSFDGCYWCCRDCHNG